MAKKTQTPDTDDPMTMALETMQDAGLGSFAWMGTTWTEAMSDMGSEVLNFIASRYSEDVKTQHEMLHCKSLTELQQAQAAYLERAYVQYTVEAGKLLKLGTEAFPQLPTKTKATPL
ncbi:phasin family protein [Yoonia sp.]|jgi:t-SNARE complex subunit (syntaxin)|uniref:phasin family protein n=1 Tax=Yoonia sp. TaxID=2212373 RepID=UPI0025F68FF2|nr:phasin family protein [Yoonia sp.]